MVGPVGFEPTTSGLRTVWSLRSPAPQVHRTLLSRSGILLAEIVFPDQVAQRLSINLF